MKLARVLALCARSTGITGSNVISTQLPAAGACAISTLRCLPSALAAHAEGMHLQQSAVMQFVLQQQDLSGLISSRHFASLGAQVAETDSDASGSDTEADQQLVQLPTPQDYRRKYQMFVDAKDAPPPAQTFDQADLPDSLLRGLVQHGFTAPTFIQAQAWPIARQGRDLVAIASTGSGKTAGFLLPAFLHIQHQQQLLDRHREQQPGGGQRQRQQQPQRGRGVWGSGKWSNSGAWGAAQASPPHVLVLAPTRELAQQTQVEADRFGHFMKIRNACLYGGASKSLQGRQISRGPQIIIATPGRLLDFVGSGELNVNRVSMLVLDEADRMLDMGFEPQIRELLDYMPGGGRCESLQPDDLPVPPRQTLFFSATWPKEVQSIARQLCRNDPVRIFVGAVQEKLVANKDVTQMVAMLGGDEDRLPALQEYLHEHLHGAEMGNGRQIMGKNTIDERQPRVAIFAETKRGCDLLARDLGRTGIRAVAVHGDKSQRERDDAIHAFRAGRVPVLVATDVAARGLDIPGVTAVVNYNFPTDHDMYVHRIGRTGRAGKKGESLTFLTPQDAGVTPVLVQIMRDAGQEVPAELEAVAARVRTPTQNKHRYGGGGRSGGRGSGGDRRGGRGGGGNRWGGGGRRNENSWGGGSSSSWGGGGGGRDEWAGGATDRRRQQYAVKANAW